MMLRVFIAVLLLTGTAEAHSFYSKACCGGMDCKPVPCDEIHAVGGGGWEWSGVYFPPDRLHFSEDAGCHVCVHKDTVPSGICIYLRPET